MEIWSSCCSRLGLFGARESCGQGLCGCCTVLVDGVAGLRLSLSGVAGRRRQRRHDRGPGRRTARSSPVQQAFIEERRLPVRLLHARLHPDDAPAARQPIPIPSEDEIRHYLAGNLCRCAAYPEIIKAVKSAAEKNAGPRNCLITKRGPMTVETVAAASRRSRTMVPLAARAAVECAHRDQSRLAVRRL